jgi:cysteine desulfurase/selenocysteine lyase
MSTSELPGLAAPGADVDPAHADHASFGRELERLANQFFSAFPGQPPGQFPGPGASAPLAPGVPQPPGAPPAIETALAAPVGATPSVAPAFGPSALAVGAGGASPLVTVPPVPGVLKQPPLVTAPPPKEADLRTAPAMFAESIGTSPLALATHPDAASVPLSGPPGAGSTPYFLELAGPPLGQRPTAPGAFQPGAALPTAGAPDLAAAPTFGVGATPDLSAALPESAVEASRAAVPSRSAVPPGPLPARFEPELSAGAPTRHQLYDAHAVKRDFPILNERVHGKRLVWLDNAATTHKPRSVIERLSYFYEHENSNIHRAAHALAARATDAYEAARETSRRFLNAPSTKNIAFVRGTTEAINLVAQSWGRRHITAGDEIVITWLEHHANIVPWQMLCREKGARLCVAPVDDTGQIILEEYERLLGPRTRLVAFGHVSNALGTIVPAREMVEIAHRYGARVLVDGAQAVSHQRVDVQALDCDFYCFSGHKIFGPTGIGVLYGKSDAFESMPPWQGGGNMIECVTFEKTSYRSPPDRFEAGTGNIADAVGLGAALDYASSLGLENIARHEHELLVYATERLNQIPGLRLIGTAVEKAAVLSFLLDGHRAEDVGEALDQEGIAVRAGHHCAQPILRRFGAEATVRASLAPYNTREDVDALVGALTRLQAGQPRF